MYPSTMESSILPLTFIGTGMVPSTAVAQRLAVCHATKVSNYPRRSSLVMLAVSPKEEAPEMHVEDESATAESEVRVRRPLSEYQPGMKVEGVVVKVQDYGAWIDVGTTKAGLLHKREMSREFVHDPSDLLSKGDLVSVEVRFCDPAANKLNLTMIGRGKAPSKRLHDFEIDQAVEGTVVRITNYGVYVDVDADVDAFIHVNDLWGRRPRETMETLKYGQQMHGWITRIDEPKRFLKMTCRMRREEKIAVTESDDIAFARPLKDGEVRSAGEVDEEDLFS